MTGGLSWFEDALGVPHVPDSSKCWARLESKSILLLVLSLGLSCFSLIPAQDWKPVIGGLSTVQPCFSGGDAGHIILAYLHDGSLAFFNLG